MVSGTLSLFSITSWHWPFFSQNLSCSDPCLQPPDHKIMLPCADLPSHSTFSLEIASFPGILAFPLKERLPFLLDTQVSTPLCSHHIKLVVTIKYYNYVPVPVPDTDYKHLDL